MHSIALRITFPMMCLDTFFKRFYGVGVSQVMEGFVHVHVAFGQASCTGERRSCC